MVSGEDYLGLFLAVTYSFCLCTFLLIAKLTPAIPYFVLASRALFHISISGIFLSLFWKREIWIGVWRNYKLVFIRFVLSSPKMRSQTEASIARLKMNARGGRGGRGGGSAFEIT